MKRALIGFMIEEEHKALLIKKAEQNGRTLSNYILWKLKDEFKEEDDGNSKNSQDSPTDRDERSKSRIKRKSRQNG